MPFHVSTYYAIVSFNLGAFTWFPCSSVGTDMIYIPMLEHGNEKKSLCIKISAHIFAKNRST